MPERSARHSTFVIERTYDALPARVFAAFAEREAKARWFIGPDDWTRGAHELDFREGGRERLSGGPPSGPVHRFDALYHDIVPNERIVYSYEMHLDATRISVSLASIELRPAGAGTHFVVTEQGVFLDDFDDPAVREHGTRELLDALGAFLQTATEAAR